MPGIEYNSSSAAELAHLLQRTNERRLLESPRFIRPISGGTMARKAIRRNPKGSPEERNGADLRMVLEAIREALKEAQANNVPGFPALESIDINLQTIATVSVSATVKFLIITIDGKVETENTSILSLTMKPPPTQNAVDHSAAIQQNLKNALAKAINLAKIGILEANKGEPKFLTNKVVIDQKFVVRVELSAGIKIEVLPVGFELKAKVARNQSHQVKLTFGK
jgi:hypothetical protein